MGLTDITDSLAFVASLQFALALPAFLFALFAGALVGVPWCSVIRR